VTAIALLDAPALRGVQADVGVADACHLHLQQTIVLVDLRKIELAQHEALGSFEHHALHFAVTHVYFYGLPVQLSGLTVTITRPSMSPVYGPPVYR